MIKYTHCWYCGVKIKQKSVKGKPKRIICFQCKKKIKKTDKEN